MPKIIKLYIFSGRIPTYGRTLLTLLTIAANTIIIYFLINRREKRLSKKLFEDQVKFQRLHEKRVEVQHKKFREFADAVEEMIRQAGRLKAK